MKKIILLLVVVATAHAQTYKVDTTFKLENPRDTITKVPEVLLLKDQYLQVYAAGNFLNGKPDQSTHISFDVSTDSSARKIFSESDSTFRNSLGNYLVAKGKNFYYLTNRMLDSANNWSFRVIRHLPDGKRDTSFQLTATSGFPLRVYEGLNNHLLVILADNNSNRELRHYDANGTFRTSISILYDVATKERAQIWDFAYNDDGKFFFYVRNKENQSKIIRTDTNLGNRLEFKSSIKNYPKAYDYVFFQNKGLIYVVSAPLGAAHEASDFQLFNSEGVLLKETSLSFGRDIGSVHEIYTKVTNNGEFRFVEYPNNWSAIDTTGKLIKYDFPTNSTVIESFNNGDWLISEAGNLYRYNAVTKSKKPLGIKTENIREFFPAKVFVDKRGNKMVEYTMGRVSTGYFEPTGNVNWVKVYNNAGEEVYNFKSRDPSKNESIYQINTYQTDKNGRYFKVWANRTSEFHLIDSDLKINSFRNKEIQAFKELYTSKDQVVQFRYKEDGDQRWIETSKFSLEGVKVDSFMIKLRKNADRSKIVYVEDEQKALVYETRSTNFTNQKSTVYVVEINIENGVGREAAPVKSDTPLFANGAVSYFPLYALDNDSTGYLYAQFGGFYIGDHRMSIFKMKKRPDGYAYDSTYKLQSLLGARATKKIGDKLVMSSTTFWTDATSALDVEHHNFVALDKFGEIDTTLNIDYESDILFFDTVEPNTLYAVADKKVLRFYAAPFEPDFSKFSVSTNIPQTVEWKNLQEYYFTINGKTDNLQIITSDGLQFKAGLISLTPRPGIYEISVTNPITQQSFVRTINVTKSTPQFYYKLTPEQFGYAIEVASESSGNVEILYNGETYVNKIWISNSERTGSFTVSSTENDLFFASQESILVKDLNLEYPLANEFTEAPELPFPNPTSEQVHLPVPKGSVIKSVKLVLPNGSSQPLAYSRANQQLDIDLPKHIHGIVFLVVERNSGVRSYKLLIEK